MLYVVRVLGGRFAEGYVASNSREQAANRVFLAAARIVEASPLLRPDAKVTADRIVFRSTRCDDRRHRERLQHSCPAATPQSPPWTNPGRSPRTWITGYSTNWCLRRRRACRAGGWAPTTSAGFAGESVLLEPLYQRGLAGEQIRAGPVQRPRTADVLDALLHRALADTRTGAKQMRGQLRPNQYLRMIENRWVTGEESSVPR